MRKIDLPQLGDNWNPTDIVKWVNSRNESSAELLEAVETAISETKKKFDGIKAGIERMKADEDAWETCTLSCLELRDRLKIVVEAQAKEQQFTKKFDEIAVFDQADRRATELAKIVKARIAWKEGVKAIESLHNGERTTEDVIFSLQDAYNIFSERVAVPEKGEFLEKVKDVFLSWYSTRIVLALQSETPAELLTPIRKKYDLLHRTDDFNAVIAHYITNQTKLDLQGVNSLPDLFIDLQRTLLASYTHLREGRRWAEKVLESPSEFVANALTESIFTHWDDVRSVCEWTIGKTQEEDPSGALSLRMVLALKQMLLDVSAQSEEHTPIMECMLKVGNRLLADVAAGYPKLASSFLTTYANITIGTGTISDSLEQLSNGLSQLIKESDYLVQIATETFDSLAILYITAAFRSMYENLISLLSKFFRANIEKCSLRDNDILRLISISGQIMSWLESDKKIFNDMLDAYQSRNSCYSLEAFDSQAIAEQIANFEKRISLKAEGDLGIAKARSELRKLNKHFVARAIEHFSRPLVSNMETALKEIRAERVENDYQAAPNNPVPSFGSTPNEFVTSAGVALLSLAHQLSAYSHDSNIANALAAATKTTSVDDVTSWWVEKCAAAVQDCFIAGVGELSELPRSVARQFCVDYAYLADVFEDLGTTQLSEFNELRQRFIELGYIIKL